MRYKQVEEALSQIFEVEPDKLNAFRARLRHLRNIGIPHELPNPGSGAQITYTRDHVVEMLIALELESLGIAPRRTVSLSYGVLLPEAFGEPMDRMYMIIIPSKKFMSPDDISIEIEHLDPKKLNEMLLGYRRVLIVNLSISLDMLDKLLAEPDHSIR